MDTTCSSCGKTITGGDVLYTADARVVCPACHAKADLVAARALAGSGGTGLLSAGAVAGALPFFITMASSSVVTRNGAVVSAIYRDWFAVGCGAVAAVLGIVALVGALRSRAWPKLAAAALVVALGGYQIAHGFGLFQPSPSSVGALDHAPAEIKLAATGTVTIDR